MKRENWKWLDSIIGSIQANVLDLPPDVCKEERKNLFDLCDSLEAILLDEATDDE